MEVLYHISGHILGGYSLYMVGTSNLGSWNGHWQDYPFRKRRGHFGMSLLSFTYWLFNRVNSPQTSGTRGIQGFNSKNWGFYGYCGGSTIDGGEMGCTRSTSNLGGGKPSHFWWNWRWLGIGFPTVGIFRIWSNPIIWTGKCGVENAFSKFYGGMYIYNGYLLCLQVTFGRGWAKKTTPKIRWASFTSVNCESSEITNDINEKRLQEPDSGYRW